MVLANNHHTHSPSSLITQLHLQLGVPGECSLLSFLDYFTSVSNAQDSLSLDIQTPLQRKSDVSLGSEPGAHKTAVLGKFPPLP